MLVSAMGTVYMYKTEWRCVDTWSGKQLSLMFSTLHDMSHGSCGYPSL